MRHIAMLVEGAEDYNTETFPSEKEYDEWVADKTFWGAYDCGRLVASDIVVHVFTWKKNAEKGPRK